MKNCKIMVGTVCAVLGVATGYALYQLKKEVGYAVANQVTDNYINHYNKNNQWKDRTYIKLPRTNNEK